MAAKQTFLWFSSYLLVSFFLLTDQSLVQAQDNSNLHYPFLMQQFAWQADMEEEVAERWREQSERINDIEFEEEGLGGTGFGQEKHKNQLNSKEQSKIKKLQLAAKKKQQENLLVWKRRAGKIKQKWGDVETPSPVVFVEYAKNNNAFGKINFQKGFFEVGAITPAAITNASYKLEVLLAERVTSLLLAESIPGRRNLQGQVSMPGSGRVIGKEDVSAFSQKLAQTKKPLKKFIAPDGVKRLRKQVRIDLMPNHLRTRVQQYAPLVERASEIYDVASELILAVIQTESAFNSRAVSHAGAVGLMQLMPATGALEASKLVYGEPKLMSRTELSRPEKNIDLGTAYLHILLRKYFRKYADDPEKLCFLAIASYNCGPVRVKRALRGQDIDALSSKELYQLLMNGIPQETQIYLKRVVERMKQYQAISNKASIWRYLLALFSKQKLTFFH